MTQSSLASLGDFNGDNLDVSDHYQQSFLQIQRWLPFDFSLFVRYYVAGALKEKAAITEDTLRQLLSQFGVHLANPNLPE
ncbi:hypothetical protein [Paenibacillus anseongensis]|uniref:Uncharacterized protein n=1 Tax=Paenibacillus anseongense TaxID=2682845 RepID=A0ABW9U436_9BACL|nr:MULTISPECIES: hypothetical protein [Paenibacillus]MVQ33070.1 hypothetical protein [Paenibacillus anseongense]